MSIEKTVKPFFPFKSQKTKTEYYDFHNSRALKWNVSYEEKMYHTSFGQTYVRTCGFVDGEPLVLMHGGGDNSSSWAPNIEALSNNYHVYAIDAINASNMSVCTRPIKDLSEILSWMDELFCLIGIKEKIHIVGMSYGAYLSARYELTYPEKVASAILIAPPNFIIPNSGKFVMGVLSTIIPLRFFTKRFFYWCFRDMAKSGGEEGRKIIDLFIDNYMMIRKCYTIQKFINPKVFSKEELHRLTVPTYFMIGEHDINYSAAKAIKQLNSVAPQIKTHVFKNAGHDLPLLLPSEVNEKILNFLKRNK